MHSDPDGFLKIFVLKYPITFLIYAFNILNVAEGTAGRPLAAAGCAIGPHLYVVFCEHRSLERSLITCRGGGGTSNQMWNSLDDSLLVFLTLLISGWFVALTFCI